jgi:hypothetical protein
MKRILESVVMGLLLAAMFISLLGCPGDPESAMGAEQEDYIWVAHSDVHPTNIEQLVDNVTRSFSLDFFGYSQFGYTNKFENIVDITTLGYGKTIAFGYEIDIWNPEAFFGTNFYTLDFFSYGPQFSLVSQIGFADDWPDSINTVRRFPFSDQQKLLIEAQLYSVGTDLAPFIGPAADPCFDSFFEFYNDCVQLFLERSTADTLYITKDGIFDRNQGIERNLFIFRYERKPNEGDDKYFYPHLVRFELEFFIWEKRRLNKPAWIEVVNNKQEIYNLLQSRKEKSRR